MREINGLTAEEFNDVFDTLDDNEHAMFYLGVTLYEFINGNIEECMEILHVLDNEYAEFTHPMKDLMENKINLLKQ